MIVEDDHLIRPMFRPAETQAILLIDSNAVLPLAISAKRFQPVAGRAFEIFKIGRCIQGQQLGSRSSANGRRKRPGGETQKEFFGFLASEAANHVSSYYLMLERSARENVPNHRTLLLPRPVPIGPETLGLIPVRDDFQQRRFSAQLELVQIIRAPHAQVPHAPQRGQT